MSVTTRKNENGNTVILDLRVSCNTFWKYEMKLTVDRDEYFDDPYNNLNINFNININGN